MCSICCKYCNPPPLNGQDTWPPAVLSCKKLTLDMFTFWHFQWTSFFYKEQSVLPYSLWSKKLTLLPYIDSVSICIYLLNCRWKVDLRCSGLCKSWTVIGAKGVPRAKGSILHITQYSQHSIGSLRRVKPKMSEIQILLAFLSSICLLTVNVHCAVQSWRWIITLAMVTMDRKIRNHGRVQSQIA